MFGQKRYWMCRQLGRATIPAKVSKWSDSQVNWMAMAENAFRGQLSAVEYALQMQKILKEMEAVFGPDLGKAAGGMTRASNAPRNANGNSFTRQSRIEPGPPEEEGFTATHAPCVAVNQDVTEPEYRSYAAMLSGSTSKSDFPHPGRHQDRQCLHRGPTHLPGHLRPDQGRPPAHGPARPHPQGRGGEPRRRRHLPPLKK